METNIKRFFSKKQTNKQTKKKGKTLPKRQNDGLLRKREIFHHSHSLSIFLFQSNASVKVSTVTDCTRETAATRKSGLNENNTHELTHGLFSCLINLAITHFNFFQAALFAISPFWLFFSECLRSSYTRS